MMTLVENGFQKKLKTEAVFLPVLGLWYGMETWPALKAGQDTQM